MRLSNLVLFFSSILTNSSHCLGDKKFATKRRNDNGDEQELKYSRRVKDKKSKGGKQILVDKAALQYFYTPTKNADTVTKGSKKGSSNYNVATNNVYTVAPGGKGGTTIMAKGSKKTASQSKATPSKGKRGGGKSVTIGKRCLIAYMAPITPQTPVAPPVPSAPVAPRPPVPSPVAPPAIPTAYNNVFGSIKVCKVRQNGSFSGFKIQLAVCGLGTTCNNAVTVPNGKVCGVRILDTTTCFNINSAPNRGAYGYDSSWAVVTYTTDLIGCSNSASNMWNGYKLRDNRSYAIVIYDSNGVAIACGTLHWTWEY